MSNKNTFELLQDLYDNVENVINSFEDESNSIIIIEYNIKKLKKAYNKIKEYDETE